MEMFLILFVLALLFVVGSAGAMRYLGDKNMPRKDIDRDKKDDEEI